NANGSLAMLRHPAHRGEQNARSSVEPGRGEMMRRLLGGRAAIFWLLACGSCSKAAPAPAPPAEVVADSRSQQSGKDDQEPTPAPGGLAAPLPRGAAPGAGGAAAEPQQAPLRKVIRHATIAMEADDLSEAQRRATEAIEALGGFVMSSEVHLDPERRSRG